jgi:hypothetical protein
MAKGAGKWHRQSGDSPGGWGHGMAGKKDSTTGHGQWAMKDSSHAGHGQWKRPDSGQAPDRGRVWVLKAGNPARVPVKLGLSNGGFTAVEGELQPGDSVIVGSMSNDKNKPAASTLPIGGPGGMGRRF